MFESERCLQNEISKRPLGDDVELLYSQHAVGGKLVSDTTVDVHIIVYVVRTRRKHKTSKNKLRTVVEQIKIYFF